MAILLLDGGSICAIILVLVNFGTVVAPESSVSPVAPPERDDVRTNGTSITVIWSGVSDLNYDGFEVFIQDPQIGPPLRFAGTGDGTATFSNQLSPGMALKVCLRAYRDGGKTSEPRCLKTGTRPDLPGSLTLGSGSPGSTSLLVRWMRPMQGQYDYFLAQIDRISRPAINITNDNLEAAFNGLRPCTTYLIKVIAVFRGLESETRSKTIATRPEAPTDVRVASVTSDSVSMTWIEPVPPCDGYYLMYGLTSGPDLKRITTLETHYTLEDLQPATSYRVIIGTYGHNLDSVDVYIDTYTRPAGPVNLERFVDEADRTLMRWTTPGYFMYHQFTFTRKDEISPEINETSEDTNTSFVVLKWPGAEYSFCVAAVAFNVSSIPSCHMLTIRLSPPALQCKVSPGEIELVISQPSGMANEFLVTCNGPSCLAGQETLPAKIETSRIYTGLSVSKQYTFDVKAKVGNSISTPAVITCLSSDTGVQGSVHPGIIAGGVGAALVLILVTVVIVVRIRKRSRQGKVAENLRHPLPPTMLKPTAPEPEYTEILSVGVPQSNPQHIKVAAPIGAGPVKPAVYENNGCENKPETQENSYEPVYMVPILQEDTYTAIIKQDPQRPQE